MIKNFFTLNRHTVELNNILSGFSLIQAFTQEKDKLILNFVKGEVEKFVEISTDYLIPYFILKEKFNRAKKNTLDFFKNYFPADLISLQIAKTDRVIKFMFENFSLYFFIRGKLTNVILIDNERKILTFKKIPIENNILNLIDLKYSSSFNKPKIDLTNSVLSDDTLNKSFPYLGKEIIQELRRRINSSDKTAETILHEILEEIELTKPFVYQDEKGVFKLSFFAASVVTNNQLTFFNTINDALMFLIIQQNKNIKEIDKKEIKSKLAKKLEQLKNKQKKLEERIKAGNKFQKYQSIANILLMNKQKLSKGLTEIELEDIENNQIISVELNPKLTPQANIEYYYDKAKSEQKEFYKTRELLEYLNEEIISLQPKIEEISVNHFEETQNEFFESTKEKKQNVKTNREKKYKFIEFKLYDKYTILVGRNSKNNDELTIKYAKQNDYWFHARNVSGSHVVLRWEKSFGEIQKVFLEKAASIAAFYSKAKTSKLVPVSYTQKKYVVKRKGMEPGKVVLLKENVLIIKPEIPKECKLIDEQLN